MVVERPTPEQITEEFLKLKLEMRGSASFTTPNGSDEWLEGVGPRRSTEANHAEA